MNPLASQLEPVLGLEHATFVAGRESGIRTAAIFERSPAVIGTSRNGLVAAEITTLEERVQHADCNIGILAVPAAAAQSPEQA